MPEIFDSTSDIKSEKKKSQLSTMKTSAKKNTKITSSNKKTKTIGKSPKQEMHHRHVDDYSEVMRREPVCVNPLTAFMSKPLAVSFDSQDKTEHIILVLRQHPITQIKKWVIIIILIFIPFLLQAINFFSFLPVNYQFASWMLWYLMVFGFSLESFLTWFFSVYIIIDERIIDVDFISLIYKDISSSKTNSLSNLVTLPGWGIFSNSIST